MFLKQLMQMLAEVAPTVEENFPDTHNVQTEAEADENVPAGHVEHNVLPS